MVSALTCRVIALDVALCVVDLGNDFRKRCWQQTLELKAEASCNIDCLFNASCLCVCVSLN